MKNNSFSEIRQCISARDAAERYGMSMNHAGFILCPFHSDTKPSLKVYPDTATGAHSGFYCFSCGKSGSVIDLVAGYFQIPLTQAADMLATDFGIQREVARSGTMPKAKPNFAKQFEQDCRKWLIVTSELKRHVENHLADELLILEKKPPADNKQLCDSLFDEITRLEYITEILAQGSMTEQAELLTGGRGELRSYERQLQRYSGGTKAAV